MLAVSSSASCSSSAAGCRLLLSRPSVGVASSAGASRRSYVDTATSLQGRSVAGPSTSSFGLVGARRGAKTLSFGCAGSNVSNAVGLQQLVSKHAIPRSTQVNLHARSFTSAHPRNTSSSQQGQGPSPSRRRAQQQQHESQSSSAQSQPTPQPQAESERGDKWSRHRHQYNYDPFTLHPEQKHLSYPLVDAASLAKSTTRPRGVRMLARDFIHDSLYNPHYGYFSKQAVLLPTSTPQNPHPYQSKSEEVEQEGEQEIGTAEIGASVGLGSAFDFNNIKNESEFMRLLEERYAKFEEFIDLLNKPSEEEAKKRQERQLLSVEEERRERRGARRQQSGTRREGAEEQNEAGGTTGSKSSGKKTPAAPHTAEGLAAAQARGRAMAASSSSSHGQVSSREVSTMAARQVWHTPSTIFSPYYGRALARYMVSEYKIHHDYPYQDLHIFELGAGSGILAHDILEYLQEFQPEVYQRTRYKIVEISARLANQQRQKLAKHIKNGVVEVTNKSILDWGNDEEGKSKVQMQEPCFIIALEVVDNLAHDVVRYDTQSFQPYQAIVSIDDGGDIQEFYEPVQDDLIKKYLSIVDGEPDSAFSIAKAQQDAEKGGAQVPGVLKAGSWLYRFLPTSLARVLVRHLPFYPNLSPRRFIPTSSMVMLETVVRNFPNHRLILSDFDSLPNTIDNPENKRGTGNGTNAPVVQTRHKGQMIPVTTYLVLQGFFDIFFPTNFGHLEKVYRRALLSSQHGHSLPHYQQSQQSQQGHDHANANTDGAGTGAGAGAGGAGGYFTPYHSHHYQPATWAGPTKGIRGIKSIPHAQFLQNYAELEKTTLKDGTNPLKSWYSNAGWFLS